MGSERERIDRKRAPTGLERSLSALVGDLIVRFLWTADPLVTEVNAPLTSFGIGFILSLPYPVFSTSPAYAGMAAAMSEHAWAMLAFGVGLVSLAAVASRGRIELRVLALALHGWLFAVLLYEVLATAPCSLASAFILPMMLSCTLATWKLFPRVIARWHGAR